MSGVRKRSQWDDNVEPEQVDDLAVAASFAHVPVYQHKPVEDEASDKEKPECSNLANKDPDSDSDGDDNDVEEDDVLEKGVESETKDTTKILDGDDDDDESEVDLTEALARMSDDVDDDDDEPSKKSRRPKTEHEIDPYSTPLEELQSNFQLNLTVEEEEHLRLADGNKHAKSLQLCPAGHISCHMVDDRTIVVESTQKRPLDEGSLLVIRVDEDEKLRLLPLGKVFEIFGPISRPLYTIRLPAPPSRPKETKTNHRAIHEKKEGENDDENEILLSDDEGGEGVQPEEPVDLPLPPDNWSSQGQFTAILAAAPRQTVYYIEDEAKLLDTFAIMRNSGKGCDASNLYDEEVLNANELYFSDDEEERQFKSNKKRPGKDKSNANRQGQLNIPGFHAPRPPPPPPPRHQFYPQAHQYHADHTLPHQYPPLQQRGNQTHPHLPQYPYQQPQYAFPPTQPPMPPHPSPPAPFLHLTSPNAAPDESDTLYY